jgi:HAD superfamily hydrolase (TIGR01458 family)
VTSELGGLLIDLDGTVYEVDRLVPGARKATDWLRAQGIPFLFTTNTSRKSRRAIVESLAGLGLDTTPGEILTAPVAAARWLAEREIRRVFLLLPGSTEEGFADFELTEHEPEAVVVGDIGRAFTFDILNAAFGCLRSGARLVAIHKNRFWITKEGETLDAGPFVAGLEYAARVEAILVGKPAPAFFQLAAAMLGVDMAALGVVGDDLESDVRGARASGLTAVQVRTGKFDPDLQQRTPADQRPHYTIDSLADLPVLLAGPGTVAGT